MLRNYIATALRNARRSPLHFTTNVVGLAVGFIAALFAALFVRYELTYNQWIPDHERIYTAVTRVAQVPGAEPTEWTYAFRDTARWLALDFSDVEAAARMRSQMEVVVTRGNVREAENSIAAADPNFFAVMAFPAIAGEPKTALASPDGIVVMRSFARRFFGRDMPMGETIDVDGHLLRVTAVLEDIPGNAWFPGSGPVQAFISAHAPFSVLAKWDATPLTPTTERGLVVWGGTYVKLRSDVVVADINARLTDFANRRMPKDILGETSLRLVGIDDLNPPAINSPEFAALRERFYANVFGVAGIGILVLFGACINYVNAVTGRSVRRAIEVGVRRASGAKRKDLALQFLGEGIAVTFIAMAFAIVFLSAFLPAINGYIDRDLYLGSLRWEHTAVLMVAVVAIGAAAGVYPALILSAINPAAAFRIDARAGRGTFGLREALVVVQFAIFIAITVITLTVYRQANYAARQTAGFASERVIFARGGCLQTFIGEMQKAGGVEAITCGNSFSGSYGSLVIGPNNPERLSGVSFKPIDGQFFRVFDLEITAGRSLTSDSDTGGVVINEAAVQRLGFANPAEAIGQTISWRRMSTWGKAPDTDVSMPILGVTANTVTSVVYAPSPAVYYVDIPFLLESTEGPYNIATLKLDGRDISGTLQRFDDIAGRMGTERPIRRQFADQWIGSLYADLTRQARAVSLITGISFFVAITGLVGLAAATAERKLKEVGIRKALGASRAQILALMLLQFCRPVILANLIAWPVAYLAAGRWLESFVKHVDVAAWTFLAASAGIVTVAVLTVIGHALLVARARPVSALRYE